MSSTRACVAILAMVGGCAERPLPAGAGLPTEAAPSALPLVAEAGPPPAVPSASPTPPTACMAFEPLGPFAAPEEACPTLLSGCTDGDGRPCECVRHRELERPAGPFDSVSVLEVHGTWVMPRAYALAVRSAGHWYVASHYPSSDSFEGGMEGNGVEVLDAPRVDLGAIAAVPGVQAVVLSLDRGDCRWPKWEKNPSGGVRPARQPTCTRDGGATLKREDSLACAIGPNQRPSCTDDHVAFELPRGARGCPLSAFR